MKDIDFNKFRAATAARSTETETLFSNEIITLLTNKMYCGVKA